MVVALGLGVLALPRTGHSSPACPSANADVKMMVINASGVSAPMITVTATQLAANCDGGTGATTPQTRQFTCNFSNGLGPAMDCGTITGLQPGVWLFDLTGPQPMPPSMPNVTQRQFQKDVMIGGTPNPNKIHWTLFPQVLSVNNAGSTNTTGTFRKAIGDANIVSDPPGGFMPVLIQLLAGQSFTIAQNSSLPTLTKGRVTVDLTSNLGTNGVTIDFGSQGTSGAAGWTITSGHNDLIRFTMQNIAQDTTTKDVLAIQNANADDNVLDGMVLTDTRTSPGVFGRHRLFLMNGAGDNFQIRVPGGAQVLSGAANYVKNCDINGGSQSNGHHGIDVTQNARVVIEHNKIHHNREGGIRAEGTGQAQAKYNLIENNGIAGTSGNGIAVVKQDNPYVDGGTLSTTRNRIRSNYNGAVKTVCSAVATVTGDYAASSVNGPGVAITNLGADGCNTSHMPTATIGETTAALNAQDGAVVSGQVTVAGVSFGTNTSTGKNAFTKNNCTGTPPNDVCTNFANRTSPAVTGLNAINNQWQHSGTASSCTGSCNCGVCDASCTSPICLQDIHNDPQTSTKYSPPLMYRSGAPAFDPTTPFYPRKVANSTDIVWFQGSGFNVIEGVAAGGDKCSPSVKGNCVSLYIGGEFIGFIINTGDTATTIFSGAGLGCSQPIEYHITRVDSNNQALPDAVATFCTNDP